jgi:amidohydrolase family protein
MSRSWLIGTCLAVMVSGLWPVATEAAEADVVLRNGKIYTADKARSIRQAIAFKGNTIVAVGDDKDMAPLIGSGTKVLDLGGKLVLPGLIDTHIHPIIGALNGAKCSLASVKATIAALKPVIRDCLDKDQGGADDWFEAAQLDNYGFTATAKDVDGIEAARPVALWGNDGQGVGQQPRPCAARLRLKRRTFLAVRSAAMLLARRQATSPTAARFSYPTRFRSRHSSNCSDSMRHVASGNGERHGGANGCCEVVTRFGSVDPVAGLARSHR